MLKKATTRTTLLELQALDRRALCPSSILIHVLMNKMGSVLGEPWEYALPKLT